jgi:ubiquinone/menaquinone biosynthesis C-methylase UbiE
MAKTAPFENYLFEYEKWFDDNIFTFLSEAEAIRSILPQKGKVVEIGVGSGIFASALGIKEGCDPSASMRLKAQKRGINAIEGIAENLPYKDSSFDYALMVTTICFVDDAQKTFQEINRILKPGGEVIVGFVDKNSPVGKLYFLNKEKSLFYKEAEFFSTGDINKLLISNGFVIIETWQTVFGELNDIKDIQQPEKESGKGSFVMLKAKKTE